MSELIVQKGQPVTGEPDKRGWLFKWTNYLKGYQKRWFVLSNGLLSYYRNQAEMAHTCRGTISLLGALIHTADSTTFVVSNGSTQTFHIKAHDEVERQSWVTALELAKAKAIRATESDEDDDSMPPESHTNADGTISGSIEDTNGIARELSSRFLDVRTCSELVVRHGAALQRTLSELESQNSEASKQLSERATLYRISCNAMMNACSEFMQSAQSSSTRLSKALQHERDQKHRLEEVVEQLARQHDNLEKSVSHRSGALPHETDEEEEHEFFDAQEDDSGGGAPHSIDGEHSSVIIKLPVNRAPKTRNEESSDESEVETVTETQQVIFVEDKGVNNNNSKMGGSEASTPDAPDSTNSHDQNKQQDLVVWPHVSQLPDNVGGRVRRKRVPDKPNYPLSLWSIMKNCIGKDLSKIPIPVNFSEPLSMLQRLCEDYEYSNILDIAAGCTDPCMQLAYVAAFTVSSYATTAERTNKPFNPLLFETYECDRMADLGWRALSEQVSHHPPMVAQHCEGVSGWTCWQEFTMTSKFRGKYLQIIPMGGAEVKFSDGNSYSWRKVSTTVHNIIVGKLWVDNHGDMEIIGAGKAAGIRAHIKYQPYSYFSKEAQRRVTGVVKDAGGTPRYLIQGHWDSKIEVAPVTSTSPDASVCKTGKFITAWERVPAPADCDKYYYFTLLAAQLNEPEEGVSPTDSRLRPDQRLMENGLWDEANTEKLRLEEKQRAARRALEAACEAAAARGLTAPPPPEPRWFTRSSTNGSLRHVYTGDYWESKAKQDWSRCPDIF